jgi:hypothetical protein
MRPPCPPFSPCWCETKPEHPKCVSNLPIFDVFFVLMTFLLGVYIVLKNTIKNKVK